MSFYFKAEEFGKDIAANEIRIMCPRQWIYIQEQQWIPKTKQEAPTNLKHLAHASEGMIKLKEALPWNLEVVRYYGGLLFIHTKAKLWCIITR